MYSLLSVQITVPVVFSTKSSSSVINSESIILIVYSLLPLLSSDIAIRLLSNEGVIDLTS